MNIKKIFESFPPPKFLDFPFSGLSISDSAIRVIKFGKKNKKLYIEKYSEKSLNPGVVSDGEVNNKEEIIKILSDLKNDLNLGYVKVSIPEEKSYLFTAKLPKVGKDEIKNTIETKIEENVPVAIGELIFDYKIKENTEKERLDIVVSSLPISVIDNYIEVITQAGLQLLSLEIESQSIARALLKSPNKETLLIVHFGQGKVALYVVVEGLVFFSSTILIKGVNAESIDQLSQEIKRLYSYWHTLKENLGRDDRKISEIILSGEGLNEEIISYITVHNQTKVSYGNVWTNVFNLDEKVPEINFIDSLRYAASVGLALPSKILI